MEELLKIFGSPTAIAIAWVCTVVSCFYAFIQKSKVIKIKQKFDSANIINNDLKIKNDSLQLKYESLAVSYSELKIQNTHLEQKTIELEKNDIHDNYQEVTQTGKTNINQGVIRGDFNFHN